METKDINGRLEIDLPGTLDLPAAAELRDTLLDVLARDTGAELVLRAQAVERISTAAVQVLLAAAAGFAGAARRLELDGAGDSVAAAFRHLGLAADLDKLSAS
ncbi:MAG: STAS domain-containing protein [Solirubrobacterales bacterium]